MANVLPEEVKGRLSLDRFVGIIRDITNDEMQTNMPRHVEEALANPTGSYQQVSRDAKLAQRLTYNAVNTISVEMEEVLLLLRAIHKQVMEDAGRGGTGIGRPGLGRGRGRDRGRGKGKLRTVGKVGAIAAGGLLLGQLMGYGPFELYESIDALDKDKKDEILKTLGFGSLWGASVLGGGMLAYNKLTTGSLLGKKSTPPGTPPGAPPGSRIRSRSTATAKPKGGGLGGLLSMLAGGVLLDYITAPKDKAVIEKLISDPSAEFAGLAAGTYAANKVQNKISGPPPAPKPGAPPPTLKESLKSKTGNIASKAVGPLSLGLAGYAVYQGGQKIKEVLAGNGSYQEKRKEIAEIVEDLVKEFGVAAVSTALGSILGSIVPGIGTIGGAIIGLGVGTVGNLYLSDKNLGVGEKMAEAILYGAGVTDPDAKKDVKPTSIGAAPIPQPKADVQKRGAERALANAGVDPATLNPTQTAAPAPTEAEKKKQSLLASLLPEGLKENAAQATSLFGAMGMNMGDIVNPADAAIKRLKGVGASDLTQLASFSPTDVMSRLAGGPPNSNRTLTGPIVQNQVLGHTETVAPETVSHREPQSPISPTKAQFMPQFSSVSLPISFAVSALRNNGLADVYSHPMSGPTMERHDRGGENLFT